MTDLEIERIQVKEIMDFWQEKYRQLSKQIQDQHPGESPNPDGTYGEWIPPSGIIGY
jgi:hypothetical protein